MRRRLLPMFALAAVTLVGACSSTSSPTSGTTSTTSAAAPGTSGTGPGSSTTAAPGTSAAVTAALTTALTAEGQAKATYDNVIAKLGQVGPFPNVAAAEARHITTLQQLAQAHGVTAPSGPFTGQAAPATLTEACQMGEHAEDAMVSMYDQLLPQVSGAGDVAQAFTNIRAAEHDSHLPAFEHCA